MTDKKEQNSPPTNNRRRRLMIKRIKSREYSDSPEIQDKKFLKQKRTGEILPFSKS